MLTLTLVRRILEKRILFRELFYALYKTLTMIDLLRSHTVFMGLLHHVFISFQIIAFDELKTDYKNPIDQCGSLNPVSTCVSY